MIQLFERYQKIKLDFYLQGVDWWTEVFLPYLVRMRCQLLILYGLSVPHFNYLTSPPELQYASCRRDVPDRPRPSATTSRPVAAATRITWATKYSCARCTPKPSRTFWFITNVARYSTSTTPMKVSGMKKCYLFTAKHLVFSRLHLHGIFFVIHLTPLFQHHIEGLILFNVRPVQIWFEQARSLGRWKVVTNKNPTPKRHVETAANLN